MKELTQEQIDKAIEKLDKEEVVILPTDTIYGLSAVVNKTNEQKINALKEADIKKPLIVLISSIKDVENDIDITETEIEKLNDAQPTTVIFPLRNNPEETIAVRVVKRPDIKKIIESVGPVFSTSVNKHGKPHLSKREDLENYLSKDNVFWVDELIASPSRIYNSITKEYIR